MHAYIDAFADGDGKTACRYLTGDALARWHGNCVKGIPHAIRGPKAGRAKLKHLRVEVLTVRGSRAQARVVVPPDPSCSAERKPVTLVRSSGLWKISEWPAEVCQISASS
jgi:hypothetical protein